MSESEEKLREQITEILASCLSDNDIRPRVNEVLEAFEEAGYLLVEPVQLEVLSDEEIKKAWGQLPYPYSYREPLEWMKLASQDTNAHNEAKGQLYRRKE